MLVCCIIIVAAFLVLWIPVVFGLVNEILSIPSPQLVPLA